MHRYLSILFTFLLLAACSSGNKKTDTTAHFDIPRDSLAPYHGIDVSSHQKNINWDKLSTDSNIKFVYIKATEGSTYSSPHYNTNVEQAHRHGILVGSYHYLRSSSPISDQYRNFIRTATRDKQDLLPMIDVEKRGSWSRKQLIDSLELLVTMLRRHYGTDPMIYSTMSFYNTNLSPYFNKYHLYIGRYSHKKPTINWSGQYTIWQYSETGIVKGVDAYVDLCKFNDKFWLSDIAMPKDNDTL